MYEGNQTRYLSTTEDNEIGKRMGTRSMDEYFGHLMHDAANPEHLDAVAHQLDLLGGRCAARGHDDWADQWKGFAGDARTAAAEARARLAAMPNRTTHPGFYDKRSATPPGHLDSDMFMPLVMRLHLERATQAHAMYEPELVDGMVYSVGPTRLGYTYLTPSDGGRAFKLKTSILRGLMAMGRVEAVPLSTLRKAA